jgi:hypothetical protein
MLTVTNRTPWVKFGEFFNGLRLNFMLTLLLLCFVATTTAAVCIQLYNWLLKIGVQIYRNDFIHCQSE